MRFLRKTKSQKTIIVISDIHLGAGAYFQGRRNLLEDFQVDKEFVDFISYYSQGDYSSREMELVINGDFFDFLSVPYVNFFDDEYWSEEAALEKLKIIMEAHPEVMESLKGFLDKKNKKIIYIIGNHDAELIFDKLKDYLRDYFGEHKDKFLISNDNETYSPHDGIFIQHGHQYEFAHNYNPQDSIIKTESGEKYFNPPWGSYYVVRVINKYKVERSYINEVRPIKNFLIHGLIFDTFFTMRFMLTNAFYFIMVRFWSYISRKTDMLELLKQLGDELHLFQDFHHLTRDFFEKKPEAKTLIVGHTHQPSIHYYADGTTFVNTGTWTKMVSLDLGSLKQGHCLTFAQIDLVTNGDTIESQINLNEWKGKPELPYTEFY